tara:strand:- start:335 stop:700 length:366 start_codon:yes stop_codon:yes gene_type:complete
MAKKDALAKDKTATFTPPHSVNLWEVRIIMQDNNQGTGVVETIDADDKGVNVLEMGAADTAWVTNLDTKKAREFIIDRTCKAIAIKNTTDPAKTMDVKVTAYRTVDDVVTGGFGEEGVVVA